MPEFLIKYMTEIILALIGVAGGLVGYAQSRKPKYAQEIDKTNSAIDNAEKLYDRYEKQLDAVDERNRELRASLQSAQLLITELKAENREQKKEIKVLREILKANRIDLKHE